MYALGEETVSDENKLLNPLFIKPIIAGMIIGSKLPPKPSKFESFNIIQDVRVRTNYRISFCRQISHCTQ